jgi:uncharacterized membrane protein (TIGR02234 family)
MSDAASPRVARHEMRLAQLLLILAGLGMWAASRMPWVIIRTFDGLGQPKTTTLDGGMWSSVLVPLALTLLVAAVAGLAVRGWPLRVLAILVAVASAGASYLAICQWVVPDVAVRAADLAEVPVMYLVGSERRFEGAALTLSAGICALLAAVLLMRIAATGGAAAARYAPPSARRSIVDSGDVSAGPGSPLSDRTIWDALDEGRDPTDGPPPANPEGR